MTVSKRRKRRPENSAIPDWLPNWRDVSQYPDPKNTSLKQWAWEFLRRNPAYQKQWQETIAPWVDSKGFNSMAAMRAEQKKVQQTLKSKSKADHGESHSISVINPMKALEDNFGFSSQFLLPPSTPWHKLDYTLRFVHNLSGVTSYEGPTPKNNPANESCKVAVPLKNFQEAYVLDLQFPIEPQVRSLKSWLKHRQKELSDAGAIALKNPRNSSPAIYQKYLRILDGSILDRPYSEMAEIIYPGNDDGSYKIRDSLKAAEFLRDTGYKFIDKIV